ncbi:MAG: hypothetical protein SangKO_042270 [Sandaracinaceae bacterium]
MTHRLLVLFSCIHLVACTNGPALCPEADAVVTNDVGTYCGYGVIEGGFSCPPDAAFRHDFPSGAAICADAPPNAGELPAEVCADLAEDCRDAEAAPDPHGCDRRVRVRDVEYCFFFDSSREDTCPAGLRAYYAKEAPPGWTLICTDQRAGPDGAVTLPAPACEELESWANGCRAVSAVDGGVCCEFHSDCSALGAHGGWAPEAAQCHDSWGRDGAFRVFVDGYGCNYMDSMYGEVCPGPGPFGCCVLE